MHSGTNGSQKADECASAGQKTIETKTGTYEEWHVAHVREQAVWLARRRRRWCEHGALPVVCLARVRGVERVEAGVLVVSVDRLAPAPRTAAGLRNRPAFLA
jgi:hypothetical protein